MFYLGIAYGVKVGLKLRLPFPLMSCILDKPLLCTVLILYNAEFSFNLKAHASNVRLFSVCVIVDCQYTAIQLEWNFFPMAAFALDCSLSVLAISLNCLIYFHPGTYSSLIGTTARLKIFFICYVRTLCISIHLNLWYNLLMAGARALLSVQIFTVEFLNMSCQ